METLSPRQRAARTKRQRTRRALLDAARSLFEERGWYGTRLEDVAKAAGVGVATLHYHFKTKHTLIGSIYEGVAETYITDTKRKIEDATDPVEGVTWFVHRLASDARDARSLMLSLLAAVQEQTIKVDRPPVDDDDVRRMVPLHLPLIALIGYGQQVGVFKDALEATEVGPFYTNGILMRVLTRSGEKHEETAQFILDLMLPALLKPPGDQARGHGESDRTSEAAGRARVPGTRTKSPL